MDAVKYLQLLGSKGLLDPQRVSGLVSQVTSAKKQVTPGRLAKVLVERGLLTEFQAKAALTELTSPEAPASQLDVDTELEPAPPPVDSTPELKPIDSSLELQPTDSSPEMTPVVEAPALEPIIEAPDLTPIHEAPDLEEIHPDAELEAIDATQELVEIGDEASGPPPLDNAPPSAASLDDDDLSPTITAAAPLAKKKRRFFGLKKSNGKPKRARGNRWDSPLMLVGGGVFLLLLASAVGLFIYLQLDDGDQVYQQAQEYYETQSYTQAVSSFQDFAERFPKHPKVSSARVKASMAMLRRNVEAKDWDAAMQTANAELPKIKTEEAFNDDARPDLSRLLPDIYDGYVTGAAEAEDVEDKKAKLDQAERALELVDNSEYLPTSLRKGQQIRIEDIQEQVALILFDINRQTELDAAVAGIGEAADTKDPIKAYAIRKQLLDRYPGVRQNPRLVAAVRSITQAERESVAVNNAAVSSKSSDHPTTVPVQVVVAARDAARPTGLTGETAYVLVEGAVYGLDAGTGRILWRRWVGYETLVTPQALGGQTGADAIVIDSHRGELLRLAAENGKLVWRLPIGETTSPPTIHGDRIYLTTQQRVLAIDANTGHASPIAELAQTLPAAPGIDESGKRLYVLGEHSSLYILDSDTLACSSVAYIGHQTGSIAVPPVTVGDVIFVVENGGSDYARLHTLHPGDDGALREIGEPQRLEGHVHVPLQRFGRRILVVTDLGAHYVLDVDPANSEKPVSMIAQTLPKGRNKGIWFPLISNGQVFVCGDKLTRYELQASRGELVRKSVNDDGRTYVGPLQAKGNVLISMSRKSTSPTTIVSAFPIVTGPSTSEESAPLWSTQLGANPSMEAVYDTKHKSIVVVARNGTMWDIGRDEIKARAAESGNQTVAAIQVASATSLPGGKIVLAPQGAGRSVLLFDPAAATRLKTVNLGIGAASLSSAPASFGKNLLACSTGGTVHLVNPDTGKDVVMPFQPSLSADKKVQWLRPTVVDPIKMQVAVSDSTGFVYLLSVDQQPKAHLTASATAELGNTLVGGTAFQGDTVLVVSRDVGGDSIQPLQLPELKPAAAIPLDGQVTWGPRLVGDQILLATDTELIALATDNSVAWSSPLTYGQLAGTPHRQGDELYLASVEGHVWRISNSGGQVVPWDSSRDVLDIGEPLGVGVAVYGSQLMLLGRDGTLYLTKLPPIKSIKSASARSIRPL